MSDSKKIKIEKPNFLQFSGNSEKSTGSRKINRDVGKELHNKDWMDQTVSAFEKSMGFAATSNDKIKKVFKTKIFNPEIPKDSELLNTLLNSTNHKIQYWKDTWTALGEYRVFVVYYEIKKEET